MHSARHAPPFSAFALAIVLAVAEEPAPMESRIPRAERLLADSGCLACHTAPRGVVQRLAPRRAPRLTSLGARANAEWLEIMLSDLTAHGGRLDLTSDLPYTDVRALAHYLLARSVDRESNDADGPLIVPSARLERGRRLFHSIGCVACHAPFEHAWEQELTFWLSEEEWSAEEPPSDDPAREDEHAYIPPGTFAPPEVTLGARPPLPAGRVSLAERHTVRSLGAYLLDPETIHPDGRMPDFGLSLEEAEDLSLYLLRDQALAGERRFVGEPGLRYERFDEVSGSVLPDFGELEASETGVLEQLDELPPHPDDGFALRLTGAIVVPRSGRWTFTLNSDDGSQLFLGGELLVDNDGLHGETRVSASRELEAGTYSLALTYWEEGGDEVLEVFWSGPGVEEEVLAPDALFHRDLEYRSTPVVAEDPALFERGRELYAARACARCHEAEGPAPEDAAPTLFELAENPAGGCLEKHAPAGIPRYRFDADDRAALTALLEDPTVLAEPLADRERLERSLARLRCYACHRRDDLGGPHPERAAFFQPSGDYDLGQEGRLPPVLTRVGSKLLPAQLEEVLAGGEGVRPYLSVRMPRFGAREVADLGGLFRAVDGVLPWEAVPATPELRRAGRQLVGTEDGLGCIQCHRFLGYDSLGIQAVDLARVTERLEPGWVAQLLLDPGALDMNTRMPSFLENGRSPIELFDGDPEQQIDAILAFLEQGTAAPLPAGLSTPDSAYELEADDGPRVVSVFMEGVSPRTVLVGLPEGVHFAFDAQESRLAKAWRGRFFNARGTWEGRAGVLENPPVDDPAHFPGGPALARLADLDEPWPGEGTARRLGQRYDARGNPTFRYQLDGLVVEERFSAHLDEASAELGLRRSIEVRASEPVENLWLRLSDGSPDCALAATAGGGTARTVVRRAGEVLVWIPLQQIDDGFEASVEVEYRW